MTHHPQPPVIELNGARQFRIIPSVYPPINFFEDLVDASEMETLWEIENLSNERLRQETGDIFLVPTEDRLCGHGSSIVMAAFTHIGRPSRFTDGSFGVYYASLSQKTAIHETVYQRQLFLSATNEDACEITMRMYEGKIIKPLHDIRANPYVDFHHHENYVQSQQFGKALRKDKSWGIVYNSVRDQGGCNIAALRPPAISIPKMSIHLKYIWDGKKIIDVAKMQSIAYA
jgi:hypothetical protein